MGSEQSLLLAGLSLEQALADPLQSIEAAHKSVYCQ